MPTATFDELAARERLRVWWAFFWRGLVITLCSAAGGAIAGAVLGLFAGIAVGILGYDAHSHGPQLLFKVLGGAAGFLVGVALSWQYVRWLFRARLAGFRLVLVREPSGAAV
jgi:ABC-type amino acid transport system permease subunit